MEGGREGGQKGRRGEVKGRRNGGIDGGKEKGERRGRIWARRGVDVGGNNTSAFIGKKEKRLDTRFNQLYAGKIVPHDNVPSMELQLPLARAQWRLLERRPQQS